MILQLLEPEGVTVVPLYVAEQENELPWYIKDAGGAIKT